MEQERIVYMMQRIVITGDMGFVGKHTAKALVDKGHDVVGYDIIDGFDLLDYQQLCSVIHKGDKVLHEAAIARFADADKDPLLAYRVNVQGTENVVRACAKKGAERLVYASTGSVYMPIDREMPITEDFQVRGNSIYGCSKCVAEKIVQQGKTPWIILRYAHLYGEGKIGHGAIGGFIDKMQKGQSPVIFGGQQSNDFCISADTLILMEDLSVKPIQDIKIGDRIISYTELAIGGKRCFKSGVVAAISSYLSHNVYEMQTTEGNIKATGNHPFLISNKSKFRDVESLSTINTIRTLGKVFCKGDSIQYKKGYVMGAMAGDGHVGEHLVKHIYKNTVYSSIARRVELCVTDKEFRDTVAQYFKDLGFSSPILRGRQPSYPNSKYEYGCHLGKKADFVKFKEMRLDWQDTEFCRGYIGGIFDAEGEFSKAHQIRISNNDQQIIDNVKNITGACGFHWGESKKNGGRLHYLFLKGGLMECLRFYWVFQPKILHKRPVVLGREAKGRNAKILAINKIEDQLVYNMEIEGSHTYIANGFLTHNTFLKDIVQANILALESDRLNEVYNIGTGVELTTIRVFEILRDFFKYNKEFDIRPQRTVDAQRFAYDITKARNLLGYEPHYTFEQGLRDWFGDK